MTISQRKKRKLRKLMQWRCSTKDGNKVCQGCGKNISRTVHHFFCNACWRERKGK